MKNILRNSFKKITLPIVLFFGICGFSSNLFSQSYYNMAAGNYTETFTGWTNWAVNWNGLPINATGTIPSATRITAASTNMITVQTSSSGGVQTTNTATNIQFLSTGSSGTNNTTSTAGDLNLNFSGRNVGNISFDLAQVSNSTGDRMGTLLIYISPDGTTWTTLTGTGLPYTVTNNVAGSASISLPLPAGLNNAATAKIRFYYYNGPNAVSNNITGSRPKISLDNLLVTSTSAGLVLPVISSFTPTSGLPGSSITITGTDFTGATAVKFNNVAASVFSVDSATQITATVPTGASTGTISVTTPNGTGTSLGTFTIPALTLSAPSSINEGVSGSTGTISIPTALGAPLVVTIGSSTVADLAVSADGVTYSASASVTIPAGSTTSPVFYLQAPLDDVVDADSSVTLTASATGYVSKTAVVVVKNIDLASADLTGSGYTETFSAMGATNGPLPLGWSDSGPITTFSSQTWGSASASAGVLTASGILGYQHTSSTGTNNLVLTLKNSTGSAITALTINFKGRAARLTETRSPVFSVVVAGQTNPGLAYSTSYGDNYQMSGGTTGLNIANGQKFTISWASDRGAGGGASQQIGLSDVQVSTGFTPTAPSLGGVIVDPAYIADTSASLSGSVTSDGGSVVTSSGFVYCLTSQSSTPTIGGTGVVQKVFATPGIGTLYDEASPLLPSSSFTVRAYAINSIGTNYSAPASFTTMAPNPEFTSGYTQNFNGFESMTTIPAGWKCLSTGGANSYIASWPSASSSAGFYGETNRPGVLGFTHTTTSSNNINTLTLVNRSGGTLTNLYVSYMGEVTQTNNERCPAWVVNSTDVNGTTEVTGLAYSTLGGTNATKTAQITGLSVSNGATYSLSWTSDRGLVQTNGSSRRIGIGFVQIATNAAGIVSNAPVVSSPATLSATVGVPVSYQIAASESPTGFWAQNIPSGLTLNASNGVISGTLLSTNANASTMVVTAYNAAGVGNQNVALTVVASVKTTPTLTLAPSASAITVGQALSASTLTGGSASVAGAFAWTTPSTVPAVGTVSYGVTFTPTDTVSYNTFTTTVSVTVNKITSTISVAPTASAITEGQALSASVLSGGTGSVAGAFAWTAPSTVPLVGTASYGVTFTPTDAVNYSTAATTVSLTVNPAGTTYSGWLGQAGASDAAFLDYVFGAVTPGTLDPSLKPTVAVTDGKLVLTFFVREETVGLTVTPKASADLAAGPSGWSTTGVQDVAEVGTTTVNGVKVRKHTASVAASGVKNFLMIQAVQQ